MSENTVSSNDTIRRFLFEHSDIRGEIVTLTDAFQYAKAAQNMAPEVQALFGEFLAGAAMLCEILKFDGLITLQARGDGAVPIIMAEANSKGDLRGVVSIQDGTQLVNDDSRDLKAIPELIGSGVLTLTLEPNEGKRYQGIVPLDGKNLAECLEHYFEQSEQIPTYIKLFADQEKCGGVFLQCLPNSGEQDEEQYRETWHTTKNLAATIAADEFFAHDHETVLYRLFHELQCSVLSEKNLRFKCSCSRERSANALISLGQKELEELISEKRPVDIDCQFCGAQYRFDARDLQALAKPDHTVH